MDSLAASALVLPPWSQQSACEPRRRRSFASAAIYDDSGRSVMQVAISRLTSRQEAYDLLAAWLWELKRAAPQAAVAGGRFLGAEEDLLALKSDLWRCFVAVSRCHDNPHELAVVVGSDPFFDQKGSDRWAGDEIEAKLRLSCLSIDSASVMWNKIFFTEYNLLKVFLGRDHWRSASRKYSDVGVYLPTSSQVIRPVCLMDLTIEAAPRHRRSCSVDSGVCYDIQRDYAALPVAIVRPMPPLPCVFVAHHESSSFLEKSYKYFLIVGRWLWRACAANSSQ